MIDILKSYYFWAVKQLIMQKKKINANKFLTNEDKVNIFSDLKLRIPALHLVSEHHLYISIYL